MSFLSGVLVFSVLVFVGDFKSVIINPESGMDNKVLKENVEEINAKNLEEKIELEELKKNIGKVGNKLEGIVYEVLKDFLGKGFESAESEYDHHLDKGKFSEKKQLVPENELKKYHSTPLGKENVSAPVTDDEANAHSETAQPTLHVNVSTNDATISIPNEAFQNNTLNQPIEDDITKIEQENITGSTESISLVTTTNREDSDQNAEQITSNDLQEGFEDTFTKLTNLKVKPELETATVKTEMKSEHIPVRRRRMIRENNEQIRPVENFVEHNSEQRKFRRSRRKFEDNRTRDSSMMGIINAPEEEIRITHSRTDSRPQIINVPGKENLMNSSNENHKRKKFAPENEHIEEYVEKPKHKRVISTTDQIVDNPVLHEIEKLHSENIDKKTKNFVPSTTPEGLDDTRLGQSFGWGSQPTSPCYGKNEREEIMEKQHIEDLKYEVGKLRSVVDLLREQQRLLNSFDYGAKKDSKGHEIQAMFNHFNNKDISIGMNDKISPNTMDVINRAKHEELEQIKFEIKQAVDNLNRTKELLNIEHEKELNLEEELKNQKTEINWLKLIMENFVIAQTKKDKLNQNLKTLEYETFKENSTENPVVGVAVPPLLKHSSINRTTLQTTTASPTVGAAVPPVLKHSSINRTLLQPVTTTTSATVGAALVYPLRESSVNWTKPIPSTVRMAEQRLEQLAQQKSRKSHDGENNDLARSSSSRARDNEFATIGKLLDIVNDKQSKTEEEDVQVKLLELVNELRRKKEKENAMNDLIRKLHEEFKNKLGEEELSQLIKLKIGIRNENLPSSKSDDLDVEDQLRILQKEINKLKPNDDLSFLTENKVPANNPEQIQAVLARLLTGNAQVQNSKVPSMGPQQLMQLQNNMKIGNGVTTTGSVIAGGDLGMGSSANINPFTAALSKLSPFYSPYGGYLGPFGPYQALYNGLGPFGFNGRGYTGGNGYFGGHSGVPIPPIAPKSSFSSSYANNYAQNAYKPHYGKIQDGVNSYSSQSSYPNSYGTKAESYDYEKQNYGGNNFFQIPNFNSGSPPPSNLPPKIFDTEGFDKISTNQFQNSGPSLPIAAEKINELKNQIHGLQNAINSYNRPEYTQTPEDRNTIHSLEQQIEELRRIVSTLNGYSADQMNYMPSVGHYEYVGYGSPDYSSSSSLNSRTNEKRDKRSINQNFIENQILTKNSRGHNRNLHHFEKDSQLVKSTKNFQKRPRTELNLPHVKQNTRRRRSIDTNEETQSSGMLEQLTSALSDVLDGQSEEPSPVHLLRRPSESIKNSSDEPHRNGESVKQTTLQNIRQQIDHLKKELGHHNHDVNSPEPNKNFQPMPYNQMNPTSTRHALLPEPPFNPYNPYGASLLPPFTSELSVKPKKVDIFKSIVAKIMDKVVESLPVVVHKLFGFAVHELTYSGDYGAYGGGYGLDSGILKSFKNLGVFGYLPLILVRIVNAISTFIYVLQKNKFLKYFLVPAGIVLLVGSSVVFLIWWLQPGDYYLNYENSYNKNPYDKDYSVGYEYQNDYGKASGQIVKSYNGEDEKQRLNTYKSTPGPKSMPYPPSEIVYPPFYKNPQMSMSPEYVMPSYAK